MVGESGIGTIETTGDRRERWGVTPAVAGRPFVKPISWAAVLAGAAIAAVCQLVLTTLGIGIGMATVDPLTEANPARGLGTGAAIWGVVSALISLGLGGYVAGYVAGASRVANGLLHGILVWALAVIASVYLVTTSAANLVGGGLNILGRSAGAAANVAATAASSDAAATAVGDAADNVDASGLVRQAEDALRAAAPSEAEVRRRADDAASAMSTAAIWTSIGLVAGSVAAGVGGRIGRQRAPVAPDGYGNLAAS